jgi:two-component system chemotaxis response regulator CheB
MVDQLKLKIFMASKVDVSNWKNRAPKINHPRNTKVLVGSTDKVIAIGASTGGTVALQKIITEFAPDMPGTVVVQHMPPTFTRLFADRLNESAVVEVKEAETGDRVHPGRVLIAPGGYHLKVERSGGQYHAVCFKGENVNGHCPSVEVLFDSMAKHVGSNAIGLILTGMGRDGADAMLRMRHAGARTFAQDAESSVVFGMPKAAYECGGAEQVIHLDDIPKKLMDTVKELV